MKKVLFILIAVLLCGTVANSQNISDTLFNDYFLPDYIDIENCGSTIYRDSSTSEVALKRGHYYFGTTDGFIQQQLLRVFLIEHSLVIQILY